MSEPGKTKSYLEQITMSVMKYIEKKNGVCQLKNDVRTPAERPAVLMWEQKNSLLLPEDLKNFYLTSNGFQLTWSVKMENTTIPVGKMYLNSVGSLNKLENASKEGTHVQPSLWDLDLGDDDESEDHKVPSFADSRIFDLDSCDGFGKVCLVYKEVKPGDSGSDSSSEEGDNDFSITSDYVTEIWFLDRSLHWHFLCANFLAYYRLMLMHLGLPHWQMSLTNLGLPPQAKQWFNMYAPIRLEVDIEGAIDFQPPEAVSGTTSSSPIDVNKIFKGKSDRKKLAAQGAATNMSSSHQNTKKKPVSSARSATSFSKQVSGSTSQMTLKSSKS